MKVGLGLHLWAGEEYYLDKKLSEAEGKKNIKLQSSLTLTFPSLDSINIVKGPSLISETSIKAKDTLFNG